MKERRPPLPVSSPAFSFSPPPPPQRINGAQLLKAYLRARWKPSKVSRQTTSHHFLAGVVAVIFFAAAIAVVVVDAVPVIVAIVVAVVAVAVVVVVVQSASVSVLFDFVSLSALGKRPSRPGSLWERIRRRIV